ncbi:MAG: 30S ribosomal protein S27e [Nitrososphaerota archaeon]|nr:30S ribosomal protein S27e [Nitrososphaerota archaeon]
MPGVQPRDDDRWNQAEEGGDSGVKRDREPIPKTRSAFLLVKCPDCGEERILFSNAAKDVGCQGCGRKLAESRGGKSVVLATIVKRLG